MLISGLLQPTRKFQFLRPEYIAYYSCKCHICLVIIIFRHCLSHIHFLAKSFHRFLCTHSSIVKITSNSWMDSNGTVNDGLFLPFRYGRVDQEDCSPISGIDSAKRLPGAHHCSETERVSITQMGLLSWTDASVLRTWSLRVHWA